MCVFLFFFFQTPLDVLFLQCQFAPSLPFWLPSNGPRDLIGQGCAFGHLGSDSQLANEFCVFAHWRRRAEELNPSYVVLKKYIHLTIKPFQLFNHDYSEDEKTICLCQLF